jgi:hypothetical protein
MLAVGHKLHSLQRGHITSRLMFTVFLTERNLNAEQFVTDAMYEYNIVFKKKKQRLLETKRIINIYNKVNVVNLTNKIHELIK